MEDLKEIMDLLYLFYKKKLLIVAMGLLSAVIVFLYAEILVTPTFMASIQVYIRNSEDRITTIYEGSDANAARSLVSTCIIILQDTDVLQQVADSINIREDQNVLSGKDVKNMLVLTQVDNAEVLQVQVIYTDPDLAAQVCNTLAYDVAPGIMEQVIGFSPVQPLSEAKTPTEQYYPNVKRWTTYGGMAGIVAALAGVAVFYLLDNTIKSEQEIKERFNLPVLGRIPDFLQHIDRKYLIKKGQKKKVPLSAVKLTDTSAFGIKEAYKSLRSNLAYVLGTKESKVMVVSSPGPNESKSTTTANLAIAIAESGKKVLLIDADMRKPAQHRIFSIKNKEGLSNLLAEMTKIKFCIQRDVVLNLDILPSGPLPPNPSELLGTKMMEMLISATENIYDVILIDTPPINIVSDVFSLSAKHAGILLISRYGETTTSAMQLSIRNVEISNISILGVVISGWKTGERFDKYDYSSNYEYISKEGKNGFGRKRI